MITVKMNDLMTAAVTISGQKIGMTNLTDTMKQELISGIDSVKDIVCVQAYKFYSKVDFDDTPDVVELMRDVVSAAADHGLLT
jgi:hypothetical protein